MDTLSLVPYLIALLPAVIFYLAYSHYFLFHPDFKSHLAAFAAGSLAAGLLALLRSYQPEFADSDSLYLQAFLLAALPEKAVIFLAILLVLRTEPIIPLESVVGAAIAGLGFSVVENILYTAHFGGMMLARSIAVTPLHFASCGIMGYFIALIRLKKDGWIRGSFKALFLSILLHGSYDFLVLSKKGLSFGALVPLLCAIILLDYFMAKCRGIPPSDILEALGIHFKGWLVEQRQFQYERWILREKADFEPDYEPLFHWKLHRFRVILGLVFLIPPAWYALHREQALFLSPKIALALLVFLPMSLILILLAVGIFNPAYFKHGLLRIPAMLEVRFLDYPHLSQLTAYDVRGYGCFVKTPSPLDTENWLSIELRLGGLTSGPLACRVIRENHKNIKLPLGSLLEISGMSLPFAKFLLRNALFRWKSGLVLFFKLPGHRLMRRLFITPESVVKDLRFFPKGTQILYEGKSGQEFFLIRQGEVEIFKTAGKSKNAGPADFGASAESERTVLARLGPGQIVGEMAIAGNVPRNASAICLSDCILSLADGNDLDSLVRQNPDFARRLLATIATRAFRSGETLDERLMELEKRIETTGDNFRAVLLLSLMGAQDSKIDKNVLYASLLASQYQKQGIPKKHVQTLLAQAARGRPIDSIDSELRERLARLRLHLRIKRP